MDMGRQLINVPGKFSGFVVKTEVQITLVMCAIKDSGAVLILVLR